MKVEVQVSKPSLELTHHCRHFNCNLLHNSLHALDSPPSNYTFEFILYTSTGTFLRVWQIWEKQEAYTLK